MLRAAFESLALFLSPFAVFALYLVLRARYPLEMEHWTRGRLFTLTLAGLILVLASLIFLGLTAERGHGVYIPAHIENGALVPGRIQ